MWAKGYELYKQRCYMRGHILSSNLKTALFVVTWSFNWIKNFIHKIKT